MAWVKGGTAFQTCPVETDDALAREAIDEAFVAGYRIVLWFASGLAVASSFGMARRSASPSVERELAKFVNLRAGSEHLKRSLTEP
jgi:hypothetical protein